MNLLSTHRYDTIDRRATALCAALNARDEYTFLHSSRVSALAMELARQIGLSQSELDVLGFSAVLHDVGKVGIPDCVLLKPGQLSDDERAVMNTHSAIGQNIVLATGFDELAPSGEVIRHHHERYDGAGYPDGLAGEDIPILARILALSDSYDAMATRRIYSQARPHAEIVAILEREHGHHDPYLRTLFIAIAEKSIHRAH
jgi:HD-GYP domain-containing protein (c-di-GMP phosphodiesterase class II)